MDINISLEQLMRKAKADSDLKARLIATENHKEPVEEFCNIATEVGCPIAMGELLALNETFCSNLLKSTNGGATYPIDDWADTYDSLFVLWKWTNFVRNLIFIVKIVKKIFIKTYSVYTLCYHKIR